MDATPPSLKRKLTFAAGVFVALTTLAYLGLVLSLDWILERATQACSECTDTHRAGDTLPCEEHASSFAIARLVPWRNEETDTRIERCLAGVYVPALQRATVMKPDREARDAVLERLDDPSDLELYIAGAFDRLIERGGEHDLIDEALQMGSLDLVTQAARLPSHESLGRRAAWLCLLDDGDVGLELMREWNDFNDHELGWRGPLGVLACGGELVDGRYGTYELLRLLRMSVHEREASDFLAADHRWSARGRRFALAYFLDRGEPITFDVFEQLRGAARHEAPECHLGMLDGPTIALDPHAARRSADRLVAWLAAERDALLDLQRRLPARFEVVDDAESDTSEYARIPADLIGYVRRVARDLHWDAGEALFAQGELEEGQAAFDAAVELGAEPCAITRWLAGLDPTGEEPAQLSERVAWLDGHGRDVDAFEAMSREPHDLGAWWHAALGVRTGIDLEGIPSPDSAGAWWRAVHDEETRAVQREAAEQIYRDALNPHRREPTLNALQHAGRYEVSARAVADRDVDLFHTMLFRHAVSRSALWARAYVAHRRGDESGDHRWFYERVSGLANAPRSALLLQMALDERTEVIVDTQLAGDPEAESPWDRPVFRGQDGVCPRRVWAHFPGVPARDDAELAFRHLQRERLAADGLAETYIVRPGVIDARIEADVVRATIRSNGYCRPGATSRSGYDPYAHASEALDEEPDTFWQRHAIPDGDDVIVTWASTRTTRAHGITVLDVEPTIIEAPLSEDLRARVESSRPEIDLLIQIRRAHYDRRAGPRLEAEIVDARMRGQQEWVRASPTRTPQTRAGD